MCSSVSFVPLFNNIEQFLEKLTLAARPDSERFVWIVGWGQRYPKDNKIGKGTSTIFDKVYFRPKLAKMKLLCILSNTTCEICIFWPD